MTRGRIGPLKYALNGVYSGGTPTAGEENFYTDDGVPFVTIGDMSNGFPIASTKRHVTQRGIEDKRLQIVPSGTILVSMYATIGLPNVLGIDACISQAILALKANDRVDRRFLYYWLLHLRPMLEASVAGSTQGNLNAEKVKNCDFLFLDLPTQRAIADFLDRETARIDQLIEKKERLMARLQERDAALVAQTVTLGFDSGRPRIPVKEGWFSTVPVGWSVRRLRDVSSSLQTGPFGSQLHSDEYVDGGTPVVNPSHMMGGRIVHDASVSVDVAKRDRLARHTLERGDIVFARRGQLGRSALVTDLEVGWLCGTGSLRMRPRMDLILPEYLIRLLSSAGVAQWLALESVGSTMDNLNTTILGRLPLPIPPLDEQRHLSAILESSLVRSKALIDRVSGSTDRLRELRAALITAAVTGQIDMVTWGKRGETDRRLEAIEHELEVEREEVAV